MNNLSLFEPRLFQPAVGDPLDSMFKRLMATLHTVAQDVDESKARAKFEDGVLTLELPKKTSTGSMPPEVR